MPRILELNDGTVLTTEEKITAYFYQRKETEHQMFLELGRHNHFTVDMFEPYKLQVVGTTVNPDIPDPETGFPPLRQEIYESSVGFDLDQDKDLMAGSFLPRVCKYYLLKGAGQKVVVEAHSTLLVLRHEPDLQKQFLEALVILLNEAIHIT